METWLLLRRAILQLVNNMKFARRITLESVDSTNNYLKSHTSLPHLTLVRARYQTAGRGQFDRQWIAEPNQNFLFSILWKKPITIQKLKHIEQAMIQSVLVFLKKTYQLEASHKQPNDIYIGSKKIAGFLIESVILDKQVQSLVIGLGLNINQTNFPSSIGATSVALETGVTHNIDVRFEQFLKIIKTFLPLI